MNKTYSVVFRATQGVWVVASEFAKGGKKTGGRKRRLKTLLLSLSLAVPAQALRANDCVTTPLPLSGGAVAGVNGCYLSGALQDTNGDGKTDGVTSADTANYKNKNQPASHDTLFSLSNSVQWLPAENGPTNALPVSYISASRLFDRGALSITNKAGDTLTTLPAFSDWNLDGVDSKKQISWTKTDGTTGYSDIYDVDALQVTKGIDSATNFKAQIIIDQPTQPFIQLTLASANNGASMNLISDGVKNSHGFAIDWKPGQVKQSALFIADGGTINQDADTPIRVTFPYTAGVNNPSDSNIASGKFGPKKALTGSPITFQGNNYLIDSIAGLKSYNQALITAIRDNNLASSDYEAWFRKAFKNVAPEYTYTYDPTKVDYTDYYISPEMAVSIGKRAIFEASGTGTVNLNANAAAIGQPWARAYNVWAHDGGTANNNGNVTVDNINTQNSLTENGAKFNNFGSLNFNVKDTNWADQVTGSDSVYTNAPSGVISVSTSTSNNPNVVHPNRYYKSSRNIATEILDGASAINEGKYFIGTSEPTGRVGTSSGVQITDAGQFINTGEMTVGKNAAGDDIPLRGGKNAETLYIDRAYNAVSAYINNSDNAVSVTNNGKIDLHSSAQNSVAINIGEDPWLINTTGSTFTPKNVTVVNNGEIDVAARNSAGLKAAGAFTPDNNNRIINTGTINVSGASSSGIFAASGAEIINDGNVVVTGRDNLANRAYGIRTDNATALLENHSNLTVKGSYTTGLYARTGGQININGGSINVPQEADATHQVVFWISGKNAEGTSSAISFSEPTRYRLENAHSTLFRIDQGATYDATGSNLETVDVNGSGSNGYTIATQGTTFTSGRTTFNVNGDHATGLNVNGGAGTDDNVKLTSDTKIAVSGSGATIATVDGNAYDLLGNNVDQPGAKLITEAQLSAGNGGQVAENAIGYKVVNKGELQQNGSIDFSTAAQTTGVYIDGGTLTNNGPITSNGIGVDVDQTGMDTSVVNNASNITAIDGIAAIRLNNGASLKVGGSGTITGAGSADAIRVMSGASLATDEANITVNGSGSGIHFLNAGDDGDNSTVYLSGSGKINVVGNNAAGITLEGQDSNGNPVQSSSNMNTQGSESLVIDVNGQGGNGIVTNTSGYVYSGSSVNINSPAGQSALVVKGSTTEIRQSGNLTSASDNAPVIDLTQLASPTATINVSNSGSIIASGSGAAVNAATLPNSINLTNTGSGNIKGQVTLGHGDNTIAVKDHSIASDIITGDGNNTISVQNTARLTGTLTAGNGANTVDLKDSSQTNALILGNGDNNVNIYGGTLNGTLISGSGNDKYTLHGINSGRATPEQSAAAFTTLDGGAGNNLLTVTDNSEYRLTDARRIRNIENLHVENNSTFEVNNTDLALVNGGANTNIVSLDNHSTYFINFDKTADNYRLKQNIRGDGTIRTSTNGHAFDFANADYTQSNFNGTLALGNGSLMVSDANTAALTHATLQLDSGGKATLAKGLPAQVIGGLTFNNGTLSVQEDVIGSHENALKSHMQVTDLDIRGKGAVEIVADAFNNDYNPQQQLQDVSRKSLLSQDEGNTLVTTVKATGQVTGKATDIVFKMNNTNGDPLPGAEDQQLDIRQSGEKVATGTYGVGATTGTLGDGLYAAYQLKQIDILDGKTVDLTTSQGDINNALDLNAILTGSGKVSIKGYGDYLSLSNPHNNYTGSTTVDHGTLVLADNTVLGQADQHTDALNLMAGTGVRFGDTRQYVGELNSQIGSDVILDQGTLDITHGGQADGKISASPKAQLNLNGGTLTISAANNRYHGTTTVAAPATLNIYHVASAGDGAITVDGTLNIIQAAAGNLVNTLSGNGMAHLMNGSDISLAADNRAFSGSFTTDAGSILRASSAQNLADSQSEGTAPGRRLAAVSSPAAIHNNGALVLTHTGTTDWTVNNLMDGSGDLYKQGNGTVALTAQATRYSGQTYVNEGALTAGDASAPIDMATSAVNIAPGASFGGYGSIAGNLNNKGTVYVGGLDKADLTNSTTYQVQGNVANAGNVILASNNATGSTLNIGGDYRSQGGALYMNTVLNQGREETDTDQVRVAGNVRNDNGATRVYVNNSNGHGAFTQPDAIKLIDVKGQSDRNTFVLGRPTVIGIYEYHLNKGVNDNSWYLSSFDPSRHQGDPNGTSPTTDTTSHTINPMVGAYAVNQNALSLFNMTLHDRLGEPQYAESLRHDDDFAHALWLRMVGSHQRYNAIDHQMHIDGHSTVVQLGHDIIHWSDNSHWRGHAGIMGGVGNQQFSSQSHRTGSRATANIDTAYSVGVYGTLYQNDEDPLGSYIDSWALYNWYNNNAQMSGYSDTKYRSHGYNLSVEAGHTFVFGQDAAQQRQWQLLPQAQLTYGQLTSDTASSDAGLFIGKNRSASLESRLGGRLGRVYYLPGKQHIQPFAEVNWRHQFRDNTLTFNEHYDFTNKQPANKYEFKLGIEGQRDNNLNGWINGSYSVGDDHYREPKAMVGIKYQW